MSITQYGFNGGVRGVPRPWEERTPTTTGWPTLAHGFLQLDRLEWWPQIHVFAAMDAPVRTPGAKGCRCER
jgi:hypothetical protein